MRHINSTFQLIFKYQASMTEQQHGMEQLAGMKIGLRNSKTIKTNYKKILYTLLSWNFDDRTYDLITKKYKIYYIKIMDFSFNMLNKQNIN